MARPEVSSQWVEEVSSRLPMLSRPQAQVLGLWSFGIALTGRCGLSTVSAFLALFLGQEHATVSERLRDWYRDAAHKSGRQRRELEVSICFAPLLAWVLAWWAPGKRQLALALDATYLALRFTILTVSVLYGGRAIPVGWKIVGGREVGSWQPHWEKLLRDLQPAVPAGWTVLVTADRGLYARWLYEAIVKVGWHPLLRLTGQGVFRPLAEERFRALKEVVSRKQPTYAGRVECFKNRTVCGTLLASWGEGYAEPWLLLTDLPPEQANVAWYGLRSWIELGFKDLKRGGWQWQYTRMKEPARAERLWLALAVATLWVVSLDPELQSDLSTSGLDLPPAPFASPVPHAKRPSQRKLSRFRDGWLFLLTTLLLQHALPFGHFRPDPWPHSLPPRPPPKKTST